MSRNNFIEFLGKNKIKPQLISELTAKVTSKDALFQLTFRELNSFSEELRRKLLYIFLSNHGYYDMDEIISLFSILRRKEDDNMEFRIENLLQNLDYDCWNELLSDEFDTRVDKKDIKCAKKFIWLLSDIEQLQRLKLSFKKYNSILLLKKQCFERRIPLRDTLTAINNELKNIEMDLVEENIRDEYSKRVNRKVIVKSNPVTPLSSSSFSSEDTEQNSPVIFFTFPKSEDDFKDKKIMTFDKNQFSKIIEDFPPDNYNVVTFIGKVGVGKSLFIRSAISTIEKFVPQSNFGTGGTSVNISTYKTSFDEMLGQKYLNNVENKVLLIDTEGTDASGRNTDEKISVDLMNKCLDSILPLAHFISTVVVFTVVEDHIRTKSFRNEIERFKRGVNENDYRLPALIVLINKSITSGLEFDRLLVELDSELKLEIGNCFQSISYFSFPALTERTRGGEIFLCTENLQKLRAFYETLINTINNVNNSRPGGLINSVLSFNSHSYIPLVQEVCDRLPRQFDQRNFWNNQIISRVKLDPSPGNRCIEYILFKLKTFKNSLSQFTRTIENNIEKLFVCYLIFDFLGSNREKLKLDNMETEVNDIINNVQKVKASYTDLRDFIAKHLPCGEHLDGYYCTLPLDSHKGKHKFRTKGLFFFSAPKYVDGNFKPLLEISATIDTNVCKDIIKHCTIDDTFNENLLFDTLLRLSIIPDEYVRNRNRSRKLIDTYHSTYTTPICLICLRKMNEFYFSCGMPHSMCSRCYSKFSSCNSTIFCPFCDLYEDAKEKVEVSHIHYFTNLNRTKDESIVFRGIDKDTLHLKERTFQVISILGTLEKKTTKELEKIVKESKGAFPNSFIQFVNSCQVVKRWCMFYDGVSAIVYYPGELDDNWMIAYADVASTNIIKKNTKKISTSHFWKQIFDHPNNNVTPDSLPLVSELTVMNKFYNRASWSALMYTVSSSFGNIKYRHHSQIRALFKFAQNYIQAKNIAVLRYVAASICFTAFDVLIPVAQLLTANQIINTMRLIADDLMKRNSEDISPERLEYLNGLVGQYWRENIIAFQELDEKILSLSRIETFLTLQREIRNSQVSLDLSAVNLFAQENFSVLSVIERFDATKVQRICYLCLITSRNLGGCEQHPICERCWKHGFLNLVDNAQQLPESECIENRIFEIVQSSNLFRCLVCTRSLINSFVKYLRLDPVNKLIPNITASVIDHHHMYQIYRHIGNGARNVDYIELHKQKYLKINQTQFQQAIWSIERKRTPCIVQEVIEFSDSVLWEVSIASLFSQLPNFQKILGIQRNTREKLICYEYQENCKSLNELLNNFIVPLHPNQTIRIISQLANSFYYMVKCGIFLNISIENVIVRQELNFEANLFLFNFVVTDEDSTQKNFIIIALLLLLHSANAKNFQEIINTKKISSDFDCAKLLDIVNEQFITQSNDDLDSKFSVVMDILTDRITTGKENFLEVMKNSNLLVDPINILKISRAKKVVNTPTSSSENIIEEHKIRDSRNIILIEDNLNHPPQPIEINPDNIKVLVLGWTGVGKSSFCNYLSNSSKFEVGELSNTCTDKINVGEIEGYHISIFDTPGLGEEDLLIDFKNYKKIIKELESGTDIIIICMKALTKFTDQESQTIQFYRALLTQYESSNRIIIVFTRFDEERFSRTKVDFAKYSEQLTSRFYKNTKFHEKTKCFFINSQSQSKRSIKVRTKIREFISIKSKYKEEVKLYYRLLPQFLKVKTVLLKEKENSLNLLLEKEKTNSNETFNIEVSIGELTNEISSITEEIINLRMDVTNCSMNILVDSGFHYGRQRLNFPKMVTCKRNLGETDIKQLKFEDYFRNCDVVYITNNPMCGVNDIKKEGVIACLKFNNNLSFVISPKTFIKHTIEFPDINQNEEIPKLKKAIRWYYLFEIYEIGTIKNARNIEELNSLINRKCELIAAKRKEIESKYEKISEISSRSQFIDRLRIDISLLTKDTFEIFSEFLQSCKFIENYLRKCRSETRKSTIGW